jgi:site-specific recombinase XerD
MRETRDGTTPITLEKALAIFLDALSGKNRSAATLRAYQTDLLQLITFLHETNVLITTPQDVQKVDILEESFAQVTLKFESFAQVTLKFF